MASKTDQWSVGDYLNHFVKEIDLAAEDRFKEQFRKLTKELESLDAEFLKETKGCSKGIDPLIDSMHSLVGRLGYCERPRGFEKDCDKLYKDVAETVEKVHKFRESCAD